MQNQSEVARLLAQIQSEYDAAMLGLSGVAYGTSQHQFITTRMENMSRLHSRLNEIVGPETASKMVSKRLGD